MREHRSPFARIPPVEAFRSGAHSIQTVNGVAMKMVVRGKLGMVLVIVSRAFI